MKENQSILLSNSEMELYRQYQENGFSEVSYKEYVETFKTELQNLDRPNGVTYMEVLPIIFERIEQNPELSSGAKETGKVLYLLAAADLMGTENFTEWVLN